MDNIKKLPNEITVRITLGFQDSPEVHTLLAMTAVRERAKLVRRALERFIVETKHPAGDPQVQLEAISRWLTARNETVVSAASQPTVDALVEAKRAVEKIVPAKELISEVRIGEDDLLPIQKDVDQLNERASSDKEGPRSETANSINRWLDG